MKVADAVAIVSILGLSAAFLLPARALSQERKDERVACASNLKQLALAAVQYADDKRFLPHLGAITKLDNGGDAAPKGSDVSPRCLRSLFFFNYLDDPKSFTCQGSSDEAKPLKAGTVFGWLGAAPDDPKASPIAKASKNDKDADALTDLSYGWTLRGYTSNSLGASRIVADRASKLGKRSKQTLKGNHEGGWNVAALDAHVDWVKRGAADANLSDAKYKAPALSVWDESNAGDEIKDEKK
jgi:hypothetical protein